MKKKPFSKSWIVIDHPQQLLIAVWISRILKKKFGEKGNLVISKHAYWEWLKFSEYRKEFSQVRWFERLDYPPPGLSLYYQFAASLLLIPQLYRMSKFVRNLNIGETDIVFGLSTQQFLENKILSFYRKTKRIGVATLATYNNSRKRFVRKTYRYSLGSFFVRYIQFFFRMQEVICVYRKRNGINIDGDTIQRYKKLLNQIYDRLLIMENNGVEVTNKWQAKIIHTRYPYTINLGKQTRQGRKKVVFLGEPILMTRNLEMDIKLKLVNKCLNYVRNYYGKEYELVYKPHPSFNSELKVLDLHGYSVFKGHEPAEIFFNKNRHNIHAVFSVCSTSSRSALNCGLPSYVFYKVFPFETSVEKEWINLLGKMPINAVIVDLRRKPGEIKIADGKMNHLIFKKHLIAAIEELFV